MDYNQVSENIKTRYERLSNKSGEIASGTSDNNINMIKNKEEYPSTVNMSEHELQFSENIPETISETINQHIPAISKTITEIESEAEEEIHKEHNLIKKFWKKHKFWIILSFIMLLLLFISIFYYLNRENTTVPNAIETLNVLPSSNDSMLFNMPFGNKMNESLIASSFNRPMINMNDSITSSSLPGLLFQNRDY